MSEALAKAMEHGVPMALQNGYNITRNSFVVRNASDEPKEICPLCAAHLYITGKVLPFDTAIDANLRILRDEIDPQLHMISLKLILQQYDRGDLSINEFIKEVRDGC